MSAFVYPALTNSQISAQPSGNSGLFGRLVRTARGWHRHNEEMRRLADMTQRELADFGASSADVYREINTPFWHIPPL